SSHPVISHGIHLFLPLLFSQSESAKSSPVGGEHSTTKARMEQCFTLATALFFQRVRFRKYDPTHAAAALSATPSAIRRSGEETRSKDKFETLTPMDHHQH